MDQVYNQDRVVVRSIDKNDNATAVEYINKILFESYASETHVIQKLQCLLKQGELKQALDFAKLQAEKPYFSANARVLEWYGRLLTYSGKESEGRIVLRKALDLEPENNELKQVIRNIRKSKELKDEASKMFKEAKLQPAIDKFRECLAIDENNVHYNATVHLNIALGKIQFDQDLRNQA